MDTQSKLYQTVSEARREIVRRQKDFDLRNKVEIYLNNDIPIFLKDGPVAVLFKSLMTPNNEMAFFLDLVKHLDLPIRLLEHSHDRFVAINTDKYHLGKIYFHNGITNLGISNLSAEKIIDFNYSEGKFIDEIQTVYGQSLVDFHHYALFKTYPNLEDKLFNFSSWLIRNGGTAQNYYERFFALFIYHGVLCESFLDYGVDAKLTNEVILPAFKKTVERFGVRPLIVPIAPYGEERNVFWASYVGKAKEVFLDVISKLKMIDTVVK